MTFPALSEQMHRLVKQAADSGAARSFAEAEALFREYRLALSISATEVEHPQHQAALLTAVALGRRVFLGGVTVSGPLDVSLNVPLVLDQTLGDAVIRLGGKVALPFDGTPTIVIGGGPQARRHGFCIRTAVAGWRGGILPIHSDLMPAIGPDMPLAAMLAAALAINEAFLFVSGGMPAAGRRSVGLSLWHPSSESDWIEDCQEEPPLTYLPSHLWLIGLGHLGQAYLWGLGLLPYAHRSELSLVLQDIDVITPSTESTSILTDASMVGAKKTRMMAAWAEKNGFCTAIYERLFDANFNCQPQEPVIALCGLDNATGRRALDQVGFHLVVEAGLGRGYRDFRTMRLHVLPNSRSAAEIWKGNKTEENVEEQPAYTKMLIDGNLDRCGVTLLAGKAVGAPFVGAFAATLALSEILRLLHGGKLNQLIDADLLSLDQRTVLLHPDDYSHLNPGYTRAV